MVKLLHILTLAASLPLSVLGQLPFTGPPIFENFDSMGTAGTNAPPGWSAHLGNGNDFSPAGPQGAYAPTGPYPLMPDNGSLAPNSVRSGYNYGLTGDSNRSLGTSCAGNSRCVDVAIRNDSPFPIAAFSVGYTGRKWRQGSATVQTDRYELFYSSTGALNSWVPMGTNFTYSSPNSTPISAPRNGLTNFHVIAPREFALDVPVAYGETFYIRFYDHNPGDTDGGISVDDFIFFTTNLDPIQIITHPTNVIVNEGGSATFTVTATGTAPQYQWYSNGVAVAGARAASFTISPALFNASGTVVYCTVTNAGPSSVTSMAATLTVIEDVTKPTVLCAYQGTNSGQIILEFSEPITTDKPGGLPELFDLLLQEGADPLGIVITGWHYNPPGTKGRQLVLYLPEGQEMTAVNTYQIHYDAAFSSIRDLYGNYTDSFTNGVARFPLEPPVIAVNATHQWKYESSGTNLGTAWRETGYDDSTWPTGLALLGFESGTLPEPLRTVFIPFAPGTITYYFRTHFTHRGPPGFAPFQIRPILDDGAVFYLNGQEARRIRMPAGEIGHLTLAAGGPPVDPAQYEGPYVIWGPVVTGDNVLAVEVHQNSPASGDMVMGLEIKALLTGLEPATITTTAPHRNEAGLFEFTAVGDIGASYSIQSSSNLIDWSTLHTFTNTAGTYPFTDPASSNTPVLFYRVVPGP